MVGVGKETDDNYVVRSSPLFTVLIAESERSVPLWVLLFDLTGNHLQVVLLAPEMLTSMRSVKGIFGDSSRWFRRRSYLILPVGGEGVPTPLLRRKM